MKNEISLYSLWRVFVSSWKKILVFVIIAMLLMGLYTTFMVDEKFSSSATFYVINASPGNDYVTTSLMQVVEHLANDYIQIIGSEQMLVPLCDILLSEHNMIYTPDQIRAMLKTSVTADASTFTVKVTNTDKNHAYIIAQIIANEAPEIVKVFTDYNPIIKYEDENKEVDDGDLTIVNVEKIRVLNNPKLDKAPDSPNLTTNLVLAALIAAIAVYLICFIRSFFNTVISTEEDISEITDKYPMLGSIPRWE